MAKITHDMKIWMFNLFPKSQNHGLIDDDSWLLEAMGCNWVGNEPITESVMIIIYDIISGHQGTLSVALFH